MGLKDVKKRGFAQNGIIPNQKSVGESKLIWIVTFRSSVTVTVMDNIRQEERMRGD